MDAAKLTDGCRALIDRIVAGPVAWTSIGHRDRRRARMLERRGWVESWVLGTAEVHYLTLTPWAVEALGLKLLQVEDEDLIEGHGIRLGHPEPLCQRWAAGEEEEPPPVQLAESPDFERLDWIEEMQAEPEPEEEVAPDPRESLMVTAEEALQRLEEGGFWTPRRTGGLGPPEATPRPVAQDSRDDRRRSGYRHPRKRAV